MTLQEPSKDVEKIDKTKRRFLSIIYFFDGGKTKSVKIPLGAFKCTVAVLSLLILWSIVGPTLLVRAFQNSQSLSSKLHVVTDALFQYQVKYNSVFERTYAPENKNTTPTPSSIPQTVAKSETKTGTKVEKPKINIPSTNLLESENLQVHTDDKTWQVSLENPVLTKDGNHLNLSIAIRNKKGRSRAEGIFWAISEWQTADGRTQLVNAPESKAEKGEGQAGTIFSIRQYKEKTLSFKIPENADVLSKMEIWMSDKKGNKAKFLILDDEPTENVLEKKHPKGSLLQ